MTPSRFLSWSSPLLVVALGWLPAAGAEEPRSLAAVSAGPAGLQWQPTAEFDKLVLTISGPGDLHVRREFAGGSAPTFEPWTQAGKPLADGSYNWELRAVPLLDPETRRVLAAARRTGDDAAVERLKAAGKLPDRSLVQSGSFLVEDGAIVPPDRREEAAPPSVEAVSRRPSAADKTLVPDDLIVQGHACIGSDCVVGEMFDSSDWLKLKANNTHMLFEDSSITPGFPATDWRLATNDGASGGSNYFAIEDATAGTTPFKVAGATPSNSLYLDSTGRVGLRTATPVLDLHFNTGNTPALRLEQNASGGFTAQSWDVAGNEANFFVRDVTGGSKLPLRIRPGAPTSSLDIAGSGNVGVGTASPDAKLDVEASGSVEVRLTASGGNVWRLLNDTSGFGIELAGAGFRAVNVDTAGNMEVHGTVTQGSSRDLKTAFAVLEPREALARLEALPVLAWSYKSDRPGVRHVGPTAEDFHQAFSLGADDKHVAPSDQAGVALLAIQGLNQVVQEKDREIAELKSRIEILERMVTELARGTARPE